MTVNIDSGLFKMHIIYLARHNGSRRCIKAILNSSPRIELEHLPYMNFTFYKGDYTTE